MPTLQQQQQLLQQKHKDAVRDRLEGILTTLFRLPALIHAETSKQVNAAITALSSREAAHDATKASLDALPAELSAYDQVLDDALTRSHDISQALITLRAANSKEHNAYSTGGGVHSSSSSARGSGPHEP